MQFENTAGVNDPVLNTFVIHSTITNLAIDLEPVFISDGDKMMEEANSPKIESVLNDQGNGELILYPNPADEYFTVQYRIDDVFKDALLRVVDVNGVTVYSQKLTYEEDQIIIRKTAQLASGSYQCEISLDGQAYLVRTIILK